MLYRMLAVGDVVGEAGLRHLEKQLRPLRRLRDIAFVAVSYTHLTLPTNSLV